MRAVVMVPGRPDTLKLADISDVDLDAAPQGRGVLVRVLQVGICGTDREIMAGEYGAAPAGSPYLVLGHENLGVVERVGPNVSELAPGDHVVAMVRRPGNSLYDRIGMQDMTTDEVTYEHGISLLHGFLREYYVDIPEYLVKVPPGLAQVGVLLEPVSVIEKGVSQAYEIQRRLRIWRPARAAVLGAGPVGLLTTMSLVQRGLQVTTLALEEPPHMNSNLVEQVGARYLSTRQVSLAEASEKFGPFDLIFEATGYSPLAFQAMEVLARNGVLVLSSVTGGGRTMSIPADVINLGFVLGNKVMVGTVNASRENMTLGVRDMAMTEMQHPGWLSRLVTHRVQGLEHYSRLLAFYETSPRPIKAVVEIWGQGR
jgi:glucose 1-dehydrogenase